MSEVSMQFELWKQCNNFCDFCYLGDENKFVSEETKLANLEKVNGLIDNYFSKETEQIKAIGFLGGEFFQGQINTPAIRENFYNLFKKCFRLIEEDRIRDLWCYCTLTIGDQKDLYELVDLFDTMITDKTKHHFWIQVSYDVQGRFNQPGKFENWNYHMLNLQKYPFIRFNVTSILTESFIQAVLSGELDLNKFQEKYKNHFFLKQANLIGNDTKQQTLEKMPWFFPKRKSYLQFLRKLKNENLFLFNELLNISLRSDYMYNSLEGQDLEDITPDIRNKETWEEYSLKTNPKCGHVDLYQCYSDSDACCLCDYFKIKENR
jgi:hypothetical protein